MEQLLLYSALASIGNICILGIIINDNAKMYLKTKAQLPLGMIFFPALLVAQNLLSVHSYFFMEYYFSHEFLPYLLTIQLTEFVGLAVFLKVTH